jgi:hypothetical protein
MAGTRSESNAVGNGKFTDLNMSFYPTQIDSKTSGDPGYNPNMKGFWSAGDQNLPAGKEPDYNMAEHVNALADAIMAMQRILGINPHIDFKGGNTTGTVSTRIAAAENKDAYYDKRYGGVNWNTTLGQTLLTHTHGGGLYEAPKINLVDEVSGKLSKANIDLAQATGITGADIAMSSSQSTKIVDAVNDKLSISQGGIIKKDLGILGRMENRTYREWTATDITTGTQITAVTTLENVARRYTGTASQSIIAQSVPNLLMGKYVLGVRVRIGSRVSENVLRLGFYEWNNTTDQWVSKNVKYIKGTDFNSTTEWQMFYLVFDHESIDSTGHNGLRVVKETTSATNINLDFDCAWIMPVHPAVFDK